ncbi:FtsK/SpoIIIE domain-containing protein [Aeromicrobium sp. 179-A 4D2 NHS]|uniref:FtsK/SpoIIIE domain-containing protein n=1 Tax=Aeromicrobium sp. 179-A 4D2 NHS TaxID=3142375 RepID=UPI0039A24E95
MANDIVHVKLPPGFDPKKHLGALRRRIEQEHGDGFEIRSVNLKSNRATAVRQSTITEVSDDTGKYLEVNLPANTKPADGDKIAIQLKSTHPGYEMTKFEPFLGTALLTKTDAATSHARASIANALGVKTWEVQVEPRRDGGYNIELPMTYVPSKHDEKLDEVATAMVGQPGWYVKTNALKRTAAIIPSEPPTFPGVIPFPFAELKRAPRDKLLMGMQLAEPGADNEPLYLDFEAAPHTQISGTSGSGKSVTLNTMITGVLAGGAELVIIDLAHKAQPLTTRIPVPISDRFKDGWALLGDLQPGDSVYAADGSIALVSSLAPIEYDADVYEVEFSDGQIVKADGQHLWPVQNRTDRARLSPSYIEGREKAHREAVARIEERVVPLRDRAREAVKSKQKANTAGLAEIIGKGTAYAAQLVKKMNTPFIEVPSNGKTARFYSVDEFLTGYIHVLENSVRSGEPVPAYRLETTETIAQNLRVTKKGLLNYSVPHAAPVGGDDLDLPIAPYILGAWLGDGSKNTGQITSGVQDAEEMAEILSDEWGHPVRWLKGREGIIATLALPRPDDHLCPYGHDDFRENTNGTRSCRTCLRVGGQDGPKNYSLYSLLEREGLRNNKHIPAEYLRASFQQRLALLQGLMDTDGSVNENGTCRFIASNDAIAEGALELARSLGIAATSTKCPTTYTVKNEHGETEQRTGRDTNVIQFVTNLPVFRLARKAERLAARTAKTLEHRFIVDVRKVESEPVRCITIDHPEHLFLTDGFIPTHNSVDFFWCKDLVRDGGWGCASLEHQVTALALVYEEGQRRAKVLAERGVTKWTELPPREQFKPIFVLLDEVTGLIQMDDKPQGVPKDHPMMQEVLQSNLLRATLLAHMKKIAAEMRFVGIRLVLSSQVSSVNTGIPTALRMNLAQKFLLGANPTDNNRKLALSDPTSVPKVPENVRQDGKAAKGVGVAELEGQPPTVFKSFYAPTEELRKALDQLGLPRTSRPEPTPMEIAKHTPSLDDEGPAAAPAYEGERAPSGRPAAEVLAEVKAKEAAAGIAWDNDVDPETGKRLTGWAKANANRAAAKAGGQKPKEN